jgi:hypothetical protein
MNGHVNVRLATAYESDVGGWVSASDVSVLFY